MIFKDRWQAGRDLASKLVKYGPGKPIVLGMTPGGVFVGREVAQSLASAFDVLVTGKLTHPAHPGFNIGAIAEGEIRVLDEFSLEVAQLPWEEIEKIAEQEEVEIQKKVNMFRGKRLLDLKDRTVILIDEGIVSEVSAHAAIESVRRSNPKKIILATPVCALDVVGNIGTEVDEFVALATPYDIGEVGLWYRKFQYFSDQDIASALKSWRLGEEKSSDHKYHLQKRSH